MGKRGKNKKQNAPKIDPVLADALAAGGGAFFQTLAPNKRHELNVLVDKLLNLTSNYAKDAPTTPNALFQEHLEIRKLLEPIRDLEKSNMNRKLLGSRMAHVKELTEWVEHNGGVIKGVTVADHKQKGLGLKATEDLQEGELVLKIPRKLLMSVETARDSAISPLIEKDLMLKTMNNVTLAIHLLLEKTSPASFWEPYINCLPTSYNTVLYYSVNDFEELKGSPAFEDGLRQFKFVARQYAYFYRKFQDTILKDYFTYDEYCWAVSTVMTRQNQVPGMGERSAPINALIPLWDMANHANGKISTDYEDTNHTIKCMSNRVFKTDEEFTIFYGARSNHDLLVHNGFTIPDNKHNSLIIRLGISKNDQLFDRKTEILNSINIIQNGQFMLNLNLEDRPFDKTLLAFLRVMNLINSDALALYEDSEKVKDLLKDDFIEDLDQKAFQYLLTRCGLLLKSYPTSLDDDLKLRAGLNENVENNFSAMRRDCLNLRIAEKEILDGTQEYCKSKL